LPTHITSSIFQWQCNSQMKIAQNSSCSTLNTPNIIAKILDSGLNVQLVSISIIHLNSFDLTTNLLANISNSTDFNNSRRELDYFQT